AVTRQDERLSAFWRMRLQRVNHDVTCAQLDAPKLFRQSARPAQSSYHRIGESPRRGSVMKWVKIVGFAIIAAWASQAPAGDIGFVEDFALAKDRAAALKQLIPGTEDYYFYHCLHYQNTAQFDKVEPLIKPWIERFGRTRRLTEIETRQALLTYDKDPKKTLEYLRTHLNLR